MIGDVYEPLSAYRDVFREKFARLAREKFSEFVARSGIDICACRAQAAEARKLQKEFAGAKAKKNLFGWLAALGYVAAAVFVALIFFDENRDGAKTDVFVTGAIAGIALSIPAGIAAGRAARHARSLKEKLDKALADAWNLMEPLNSLYSWDVTVKLIEATVPRLAFDPFFTAKRLADLKRLYGWDDGFNDGKSIVFAQSGVINGNPFLFGEYLEMEWGTETYHGSLDISWTEFETDERGNRRRVTRHETLHASVTKPKPEYSRRKVLVYGNDAAPNLSFSRKPSGFDDNDLFDGIRKRWRIGKLKRFSRNLKDESNFTMMSNHEFEAWFNAVDRDNEVEFRLLFTALAQTQMMALMKDTTTGFGDDFTFRKVRKINLVGARHLDDAEIDTDPKHFRHWDIDAARANFLRFNEKYFRDAYFALAPLLAIPLYQQTRPHEEIWKGVVDGNGASFWEHEAIANYYGEKRFAHPACITRNILKTRLASRADGVSEVEVVAHGFCGEKRIDREEVFGGDGKWHWVPVEWIEYLPVEKTTGMTVCESSSGRSAELDGRFGKTGSAVFRRSIYSFLGR